MKRLPGLRVLVVEDNPVIAFDLDDTLKEQGVEVVGPALDLASGLALARDELLDGAVLDIDIGGEPVWPIARQLMGEGVPFVFVSGEGHRSVPADFDGAVCIDKPAAARALLLTVAEIAKPR